MAEDRKELVEAIVRRAAKMKSDRGTWESHWQEVADRVMPRKSHIIVKPAKGEKRTDEIFDSTAVLANQYMAAGFFGWLCPPDQRWFAIKAKKKELANIENVKNWWANVTTIVHEEKAVSNFNLEINELFLDLGWCGTACLHLERGIDTLLNYTNHHISEYGILENAKGKVDTVYRWFDYSARQAVEEFGIESLSKDIQDAFADPKSIDKKFGFIHAVFPRSDYDKFKLNVENQPIASIYVEVKAKHLVAEEGYREMPKMIPRFTKSSNEIYGRSPAMALLPHIKSANIIKKSIIQGTQLEILPPIIAEEDSLTERPQLIPGGLIPYRKGFHGADKPEPFRIGGDTEKARQLLNDEQAIINSGFYNDLFLMLNLQRDKTKTATETLELVEEKLVLLGPTLGRLQSELFNPDIVRCVNILGRAGRLPPIPEELAGEEYEIEYVSKLALAMKLVEIGAFRNAIRDLADLASLTPEAGVMAMDNYDVDKIARGIAERRGVPTDFMKPEDQVEDERQARAEAQQAQQLLEAADAAADAVPKLQGKTEEGSPLAELAGVA